MHGREVPMKIAPALIILLGLWLCVSPGVWQTSHAAAVEEDIAGGAVVVLALLTVFAGPTFTLPSWIVLVLGAWIALAPGFLHYGALLRHASQSDIVTGLLIALCA